MKIKKPNAELVWKQLEDQLVPQLRLSLVDRTVYAHLLRHSHLEGKLRVWFSIRWLARNIRLSSGSVRQAVRRLVAHGALRLVQRSKTGHVMEVRLPAEIRPVKLNDTESAGRCRCQGRRGGRRRGDSHRGGNSLQNATLRKAIHARERGQCFYCLRRTSTAAQCPDHVVARVRSGCNSYRNLVSSCIECNSRKREKPADNSLRPLHREGQLNAAELAGRLRALDDLASGRLRPSLS